MIDDYVCVSVCLSASISPEPHERSLPVLLCVLPVNVARTSSGRVTKSYGEEAILGVVQTIQKQWQVSLQRTLQKG